VYHASPGWEAREGIQIKSRSFIKGGVPLHRGCFRGVYSGDAIQARFEVWADKLASLEQAGGAMSRNPTLLKTNFALPRIS